MVIGLWGCKMLAERVVGMEKRGIFVENFAQMKLLKERILADGKCFEGGILKVDNFINHQMDPTLMHAMAQELATRFEGCGANKILTVEASGIAPAIMVGYIMGLPVVFAKKRVPSTMEGVLTAEVHSFTKNRNYTICVSSEYLHAGDRVLFVDDFLAYGNAAVGTMELVTKAGAELVGMGFLVEKAFQKGREVIESRGIRTESLARIASLEGGVITLAE